MTTLQAMTLQTLRRHLDTAWLSAQEARRTLEPLANEDNVHGFSSALAAADIGRVMREIEHARVELERLLTPPATIPMSSARPIVPADAALAEAAAGWLTEPEVPA